MLGEKSFIDAQCYDILTTVALLAIVWAMIQERLSSSYHTISQIRFEQFWYGSFILFFNDDIFFVSCRVCVLAGSRCFVAVVCLYHHQL
eukprot:scaffold67_cov80-Cylindrotheca_fusiformis.AAC.3